MALNSPPNEWGSALVYRYVSNVKIKNTTLCKPRKESNVSSRDVNLC